jgi:hypothetical protein
MKHSAIATLVLPALVAGTVIVASAHAQYSAPAGATTGTATPNAMGSTNMGTPVGSPGVSTVPPATGSMGTGSMGAGSTAPGAPANGTAMANNTTMPPGGVGSGMNPGVGPPIGGLDSNPYAEAPRAARALGYPYHPPGSSGSTARTTE